MRILGGSVLLPGSPSPDPISDQKYNFPYPFSKLACRQKLCYHRFEHKQKNSSNPIWKCSYTPIVPSKPFWFQNQNGRHVYPFSDQKAPIPLCLDQTETWRAENFFLRPGPPYLRVWMTILPSYLKVWICHSAGQMWNQYTCQLFLRYKCEIFILGVLGFLKTTRSFPKIPEEFRSLPKTSEVFRRRPKSAEGEVIESQS